MIRIKREWGLKFLCMLVFAGVINNCSPVSERTAKIVPVVGGVAAGIGAGALTYALVLKNWGTTERILLSSLAALGVGGLTWYALDCWLSSLTPRGKYVTALNLVRMVEGDSFICGNYATADDLIRAANVTFGTSWPLVLAREYIMNAKNMLIKASKLLSEAQQEARQDSLSSDVVEKCSLLLTKIPNLAGIIECNVNILVNHKDYIEQTKLYERHMEKERQLLQEQMMKEKDRWHDSREKQMERDFQRQEKEKDRLFKERILNDRTRPVSVTI